MQDNKQDRSLGDLFGDLTRDLGTLVRKEVELAKTEMTAKVSKAGRDAASIAVGGAVAYAGFLALLAALIIGLGMLGLPWWLSALLVGLVVVIVGYILIQRGLNALKKADMAPRQTVQTIKEDADWAKEQTR